MYEGGLEILNGLTRFNEKERSEFAICAVEKKIRNDLV
jgi:hypothetical protein